MEFAGGDKIEKYKRKIGNGYHDLKNSVNKKKEAVERSPVVTSPSPYPMRTRKRDDKKATKEIDKKIKVKNSKEKITDIKK